MGPSTTVIFTCMWRTFLLSYMFIVGVPPLSLPAGSIKMFLVYLAVVCSALSFFTGIVIIGSGKEFQYEPKHLWQGRRDAVLYVWVIFSSMFALAHCASLLDYGIVEGWGYRAHDTGRWMAIHSGVGALLTTAHLFIRQDLSDGVSSHIFLWGARRRAV